MDFLDKKKYLIEIAEEQRQMIWKENNTPFKREKITYGDIIHFMKEGKEIGYIYEDLKTAIIFENPREWSKEALKNTILL